MKKLYPMSVIALIFIVGIGFILYPSIGNFVTLNTASVTISGYDEKVQTIPDEEMEELLHKAQQFNESLYRGTNKEGDDRCLGEDVICYLDIPSIHVYLPVYYGTSEEVLLKGCGYIENTSLPVGGENTHTGLSGHTGLPGAELLSSLDKMEKGDVFYLHVLESILAYEVELVKVVEPDDSEDLEIVPGRDLATLVTCTPYGINSHRLLVRGKRIPYLAETEPEVRDHENVQTGLSEAVKRQLAVIIAIVVFAAVSGGTGALYSRKLKRMNDEYERANNTLSDGEEGHDT